MLQWQVVQHKIDGEFKYTISLVDVEDSHLQFRISINVDKELNECVAIINTDEGQIACKFPPNELWEFILENSYKFGCVLAYR